MKMLCWKTIESGFGVTMRRRVGGSTCRFGISDWGAALGVEATYSPGLVELKRIEIVPGVVSVKRGPSEGWERNRVRRGRQ
jgi:hypothetical protein